MITQFVLTAVFISVAVGTLTELNQYMDDTLVKLPLQALVIDADPVELPSANFVLRGDGFTERDIEVNIIRGSLSGLSSIKRRGNCSYDYFDSSATFLRSCYLTLDTLRILSKVDVTVRFRSVRDDSAFAMTHTVSTSTRFENDSFLLLQLSRDAYNYPSIKTIKMFPLSMTSSVTGDIPYLIKARLNAFGRQLNAAVAEQASLLFNKKFYVMIKNSIKDRKLP